MSHRPKVSKRAFRSEMEFRIVSSWKIVGFALSSVRGSAKAIPLYNIMFVNNPSSS